MIPMTRHTEYIWKCLYAATENDAAKTAHAVHFLMNVNKRRKGMSKGRDLHHIMKYLLQNSAECFTKGKTDTQSANTLRFGNCWLQTRAILSLFHGWLVSFGGKSLYRLPWSLKHTYLVWNGTKWDLIGVSTVFILLPERARVSLEILQIWKMFKKTNKHKTQENWHTSDF